MPRAFNLGMVNGDVAVGVAAAGTTQGTATTAPADHIQVSTVTASARGIILRVGNANDFRSVSNADSVESLNVYPPSGCAFNGATANLPVVVPSFGAATFVFLDATKITAMVSP